MKSLSNNQELYKYLLDLTAKLENRNAVELSKTVASAGRHASGMSTEFLGESRIALRRVLEKENGILIVQERADLTVVLEQLNNALDNR